MLLVLADPADDGVGQARNGSDRVQYVGRSGTTHSDGTLSRQTLRTRLTNRQRGTDRERFFRQFMDWHAIEVLEFEWFVTFGGAARVLPALAEHTRPGFTSSFCAYRARRRVLVRGPSI